MDYLQRGREAYEQAKWPDAFRLLSYADVNQGLGGEDLWRLAVVSLLLGHDGEFETSLERACRIHQDGSDHLQAAWCAFWLGFALASRGDVARSSGWLSRSSRLVERSGCRSVVEGYLLLPRVKMNLDSGSLDDAFSLAQRAGAVADKFGDRDLHAFALHVQGVVRLRQGRVTEGLTLLDESMITVASDEMFPIMTGIVYCSVISACLDAYALRRAQQWTKALSGWCSRQPGLVLFAGNCMVKRAEILRLHGYWEEAYAEACLAEERCRQAPDPEGEGASLYAQAELLRLRGRFEEAEDAYRQAANSGFDPQPGLALLRAEQGRYDLAASALRRALEESHGPTRRARILPALVTVTIATGEIRAAREAFAELAEIAVHNPSGALRTVVAHTRGAVELAAGNAATALASLRAAWRGWQALEAPYEAALVRELVARACEALGDGESAALERKGALATYRELGATRDLERLERSGDFRHGLTARELEVVRLVASGSTNKGIADGLGLSVRTVERHLANIFGKLEVSSRSAVTAFAYEHGLA